jgi:hypothetical protein
MEDFEKLGVFYLGREYDLGEGAPRDNLLLYDSKDLVTHAVCVGMTGSGKTGLCIGLLEEAAIDGIPSLVVDPKGDLANLLLTFPDLEPRDFLPWINPDDARREELSEQEYAETQAALWRKGLSEWGQNPERIRRLREAADFSIYTPGSSAGLPVSILRSFAAPEESLLDESDLVRERIVTTVTGLLGLVGIEADPVQSREHILLSTILDLNWRQGQDLDLASIIRQIQSPPVTRIGVFDLESFFPSKERFSLAMRINNLIAAPSFAAWLEGEPLDIGRMLFTAEGKPRVSIVSIAHLTDAERMFFVSLLLTQLLGWTRRQSGTSSLRAVFYMDEIFGYFPPVANPPSKQPLLTLLKQARAFGLGIVLATQNPVDLDYKGLSNTGTWFIGRLQTERDKARLLEGLEGVGSSAGGRFDRQRMGETLAGLKKRVFLMNNVHEDAPVIFETRWVMSYLRGPLTRDQIKMLMKSKKEVTTLQPLPEESRASGISPAKPAAKETGLARRLVLDPQVPQHFAPVRSRQPEGSELVYKPALFGSAKIFYADAKIGTAQQQVACVAGFSTEGGPPDWDLAEDVELSSDDLEKTPEEDALFLEVLEEARDPKSYSGWGKSFKDALFRTRSFELLKSPTLKLVSQPGESERDFRIRLQLAAREERDRLAEKLRQKYTPKIASLQDRTRLAQQAVEREEEQAKQQKMQTAISIGATLLSAFAGRKTYGRSALGRATTAARGASRSRKEAQDIERAKDNVKALEDRLKGLESEFREEMHELEMSWDPRTEELDSVKVRPKKSNISIEMLTLLWMPFWQVAGKPRVSAF